ncbi:MAG: hypothetical protein FJX23_01420 [Alphaproteobacteria bacterium]|nr:hypothetical protein [Alphaproteobacteria bacterium]
MRFDMNGGNQNDEEDFDLEDEGEDSSRGFIRVLSGVFVLAAIGGFVALAWYAYQAGNSGVDESDIPLVAEEEGPIKETPKEPGGWQFEHQDKSVYNQLAAGKGSDAAPVAERIMPATEEPVERADLPPEEVTAAPVAEPEQVVAVQQTTSASQVETEKPATEHQQVATESVIPTPAPAAQPLPVEEVKSVPVAEKPVAAPAPVVAKETPKPAASSGKYMAQLGAFGSQDSAEKAWSKISAAHGSKFPTKSHKVERADLGSKSVYRLQMGPFDSEASARKVCSYLSEQKQACFIVKN